MPGLSVTPHAAVAVVEPPMPAAAQVNTTENVATSIKKGCLPCTIGHFSTCTGLLNEAMRFARAEGLGSDHVQENTQMCLDELNALERVDLRPERIEQLPAWEKELAIEALGKSREFRHEIEGLSDVDALSKLAANTQGSRMSLAKRWAHKKLASLPVAEQKRILEKARHPTEEGTPAPTGGA
ncbi:MAG: hypothetical protein ACYDHZ_00620 [Dehalococcoidia bacterium]